METIRAIYHHEPDGWWADSPDLPGWSAASAGLDELRALVEDGARFALERDDVVVQHMLDYGLGAAATARLQGARVVFDFVSGQTVQGRALDDAPAAASLS